MALRSGSTRYAVRIQYHGGSFLGVTQQKQEDCIQDDGVTDLRGYTSVETRLRRALHKLVPSFDDEFQMQISSRTDRGVHALGNTLHIDLPNGLLTSKQLLRGWQYHLMRDEFYHHRQPNDEHHSRTKRIRNASLFPRDGDYIRAGPGRDVCILNAVQAPLSTQYGTGSDGAKEIDDDDWNARFSATERLYVYRILQHHSDDKYKGYLGDSFEWDRSWRIRPKHHDQQQGLNLRAMQSAANVLVGQHDFSSFRAKGCQQSSPIVHVRDIRIDSQSYGQPFYQSSSSGTGGMLGLGASDNAMLITISVRANSFLYRMVRNLVGYLVHVGQHDYAADELTRETIQQSTRDLLDARNRNLAPSMAPAHGLFLAHVQHGAFNF